MEFGFFNLDCMEGMKSLPDQSIDLAITDPPYGINIGQSSMGAGGGCTSPQQVNSESAHPAGGTRLTSRLGESKKK